MNLNQSQIDYVNVAPYTNTRLLAPAGCGKTLTLLHRAIKIVRDLEDSKIKNPKILILTFTNAARIELENRIQEENINNECFEVCTLNKWGTSRLRERYQPRNGRFTFFENADTGAIRRWYNFIRNGVVITQREFYDHIEKQVERTSQYPLSDRALDLAIALKLFPLLEFLKELGVPLNAYSSYDKFGEEYWARRDTGIITGKIDRNTANTFQETIPILNPQNEKDRLLVEQFLWVAKTIITRQLGNRNNGLFSFNDQKYLPLHWFRENSFDDLQPYHHIFVDEFQDINALDLQLILAINEYSKMKLNGNSYVSIVGDPDQAIFEWRGSVPDYIVNSDRHFQELETIQLDKNYRMPKNIVNASQNLIRNNTTLGYDRITVAPMVEKLANIEIWRSRTANELVHKCVDKADLVSKRNKSIALISRKRSQLILAQILMIGKNIDFTVDEDLNFTLGTSFENILSCLEILPFDINSPMPKKDVADIITVLAQAWLAKDWNDNILRKNRLNITNLLSEDCSIRRGLQIGADLGKEFLWISKYFYPKAESFLQSTYVNEAISELLEEFKGFEKLSAPKVTDDIFRLDPPFQSFPDLAEEYDQDFERFVKEMRQVANRMKTNDSNNQSKIHLLTATRAKGREFDCVIILDAVEDIWPCVIDESNIADILEEERRLFYVAMTRAKEELIFVVPDLYYSREVHESRFIKECEFDMDSEKTKNAVSVNH